MKRLIYSSNLRAQIAIVGVRIQGRNPETMAELRDAMRQRSNMRASAHYALWQQSHEAELKSRFNWFVLRNPFRLSAWKGLQAEFADYCQAEFQQSEVNA